MLKRKLGRTGPDVAVMGIGTLPQRGLEESEALKAYTSLINRALERGVNYIHIYANQEKVLARVLSDRRKEFNIGATVDVSANPEKKMGTADELMGRIETSLKNLKTDCIEVFQFHKPDTDESLNFIRNCGAMEGVKKAKEQGKIQCIGLSGHYSPMLIKALKTGDFDTVMVPFNVTRADFFGTDPSLGLLPLAKRMGVGVIAMKPLAQARFTKNISTALKFVMANDIAVTVPGCKNVQEFDENVDAAEEFSALSEEKRKQYADESFIFGELYCRHCGYCLPCPGEMNITAILRLEQLFTVFGMQAKHKRSSPTEHKILEALDPEKCANCGLCESKCPFDLPVRQMIKSAWRHLQA